MKPITLAPMRNRRLPNLSEVLPNTQMASAQLVDHMMEKRLEFSVGPVISKQNITIRAIDTIPISWLI